MLGVLKGFHNSSNSDMDYRMFSVHTYVNACDCTRGCMDTVRESALKVYSGRKIPCRTGESNLRWQRADPMLYQLSYIPTPTFLFWSLLLVKQRATFLDTTCVEKVFLVSRKTNLKIKQKCSQGGKYSLRTPFCHHWAHRTRYHPFYFLTGRWVDVGESAVSLQFIWRAWLWYCIVQVFCWVFSSFFSPKHIFVGRLFK